MLTWSGTARLLFVTLGVQLLLAVAQSSAAEPTSGLINPQGIGFDSANRKVWVVDPARDAVDVIDTASQAVREVAVGKAPVSVAVDAVAGRIYVANSGDGTVSAIDGVSQRVVATVAVGAHPYSIAVNRRTGEVFVSHTFSDRTTVLDGATGGVTQLPTGSADLIAIDEAANTAYLLGYEGGTLTIVEGAGHAMRKRETGKHAWGMALNEATHTLYVARMGTGNVIALRGETSSILPAGQTPCAVAVNAPRNVVYVANYADSSVSVLNGETGRSVATIPVGEHPQALAVDEERNLVYVVNTGGNSVTVLDGERNRAVATMVAGKAPYALAVQPGSSRVYVANEGGERAFAVVGR